MSKSANTLPHDLGDQTHEVFNQPTPLENYNAFTSDQVLQYWIKQFGGADPENNLRQYGQSIGHELQEAGILANANKPQFDTHDRFGHRIDLVKYHPAYHQLMRTAIQSGLHSAPWTSNNQGRHIARAAMAYLHNQADAGTACPLTMTFASVPVIQGVTQVATEWLPKILARHYDGRNIPWFEKKGVTIGMAMTEKQGGSDVGSNTTRAFAIGPEGPGEAYKLLGHKWFCSAPMSDAFLVLAQGKEGLSCFLMPRWCSDGSKNSFYIQRIKNKMGNQSNASSEIEFRGASATMIGNDGRGIATIIEMIALTRFDCMVGSSALMRASVAQIMHHTRGRKVFGEFLYKQPLMQNVLADLAIESEAALALTMRAAYALDHADDEQQALFTRIATAVGKYWICKRAIHHAAESMECIGGVGYIEDNIMPRIYREAPVNSIWEGSGNIQCLDVLRSLQKTSKIQDVFINELEMAKGMDKDYDQHLLKLKDELIDTTALEYRSRRITENLALGLQAAILLRLGTQATASAFIASRIKGNCGLNYGTLPQGIDCAAIIQRATPYIDVP